MLDHCFLSREILMTKCAQRNVQQKAMRKWCHFNGLSQLQPLESQLFTFLASDSKLAVARLNWIARATPAVLSVDLKCTNYRMAPVGDIRLFWEDKHSYQCLWYGAYQGGISIRGTVFPARCGSQCFVEPASQLNSHRRNGQEDCPRANCACDRFGRSLWRCCFRCRH